MLAVTRYRAKSCEQVTEMGCRTKSLERRSLKNQATRRIITGILKSPRIMTDVALEIATISLDLNTSMNEK